MYIVIKTIKGRQYAYEQRSRREGKRVRTESRYLGPVGGTRRPVKRAADVMRAPDPLYRSLPDEEDELLTDVKAQDAAYARMLERAYNEVRFRFNISRDPHSDREADSGTHRACIYGGSRTSRRGRRFWRQNIAHAPDLSDVRFAGEVKRRRRLIEQAFMRVERSRP